MQINIDGNQVEVALYTNKKVEAFHDLDIALSDLREENRYYGIATISDREYFLKFSAVSKGGIWPHEITRLKIFEDSLYTPKLYYIGIVDNKWEVLITEKCPGYMLTPGHAISIDDGIFILDQLVNFLRQLYSEKLIVNGQYYADITNPENYLWDKKKRQLYFVDFGPCNGPLFKDLIKHFLRVLELKCGAIDNTLFENFIDQYFDLLYDLPIKKLDWVVDFKKRCNEYHSGQPYQTVRITKDYYMEGARAIQPRLRFLNLGNLYNKTVLDLGCNLGGFCIDAKRRNAKVAVGYDVDKPIIEFGMELAEFLSLEIFLYHAELSELTTQQVYDDSGVEFFDHIFFFSSWPYVKDKIKFIEFLKKLNFKTMYWEFNMFSPRTYCEETLQSSEIFKEFSFLGYTDVFRGKLNARALYKCIKE